MLYKAYFDGSCFLQYCGIGYFIRDSEGFLVCRVGRYAGRGDALKAEYLALMGVLNHLQRMHIQHAIIHGDSRTVVHQVNGRVNTRERNRFRKWIEAIRLFFVCHPSWILKWVPRGENGLADALATESLSQMRLARKKGRNSVKAILGSPTVPRRNQDFLLAPEPTCPEVLQLPPTCC